jgi:hypothetical protein
VVVHADLDDLLDDVVGVRRGGVSMERGGSDDVGEHGLLLPDESLAPFTAERNPVYTSVDVVRR